MRVLMLSFLVGLTYAAPQGYNYQFELGTAGNSVQAVPNQYQFIQQQQPQQQQQQPQIVYQEQLPQYQQFAQTLTSDQQGGYQFGNQLLQNAQQVIQFEQQQHQEVPQQQQQHVQQIIQIDQKQLQELQQQVNEQPAKQLEQHQEVTPQQQQHSELQKPVPAPVVEEPPTEIVETIEPLKPVEKPQVVVEPQPHFIIQTKKPTKPEPIYHGQVDNKKITFEKEFYYLSAPQEEEEDENPKDLEDQLTTLKKNLRVLFIKAPENNSIEKAALKLAQQSVNAQTAIYVLTKQHSASDLAQKLQSIQKTTPQRPEVAFIKYRTPEEAEHAQRVIQAQYEALDGPNHINRPVTGVTHNFVGSNAGGIIEPRQPTVLANVQTETRKPVSKYLPTSAKH